MSRTAILVNRITNAIKGIYQDSSFNGDTKHQQAWSDYGFPISVTFDMHFQMYTRFGIASAGIDAIPEKCWSRWPCVYEGEEDSEAENREDKTAWESNFYRIAKKHKLWQKMLDVDKKQRVYQYGAFVIQVKGSPDQADWSQPLDQIRPEQIVKITPVYQSQLKPSSWDSERTSERYGQPVTYTFEESEVPDLLEESRDQLRSVTIHHSRVIVFAEGAVEGSIYGTPTNQKGFNDLITLFKIIGAGGEGFYKNAAAKMLFSQTDKDAPPLREDEIDSMDEAIKDFLENLDKHLMTGGLKAETQSITLADPEPFFNAALSSYAASVKTPHKILIGAQTGKLAADDDSKNWLSDCQSRSENWGTTMAESFIDWLIEHRVIEDKPYMVTWTDLMAPSDKDKLEIADKMATVNQKLLAMGEIGFTGTEIRAISGYEPLDDSDIPDIDDEEAVEGKEDERDNG